MRLLASLCLFSVHTLLAATPPATAAPPDYRFKVETLIEAMPQPMQIEIAPDGRIFFIEIGGKLRILKPAERQVIEAGTLEVTTAQENGLLGMALDPDFARNQFIYLLHSPKDFTGQKLSRFVMKGDQLDPSSRIDMLSYGEQREQCCHHAGALRFGPDGNLYISTGDNTNPFEPSEGYAPIDERPNRGPWDAQKSSANTDDLRGKILRIKPTPDGKYTIPAGNLFPPGTPQTRPEIYVMGLRNPWRFNFDAKSGFLYFGDVGPDAGGDKPGRGPRGFDTINQVRQAGNYGWPLVRGHQPYHEYDYETNQSLGIYDPKKPINNSPNNTGLRELPPVQPPFIWYPAGTSEEFPLLGKGGRTACAGPVFHFRPEFRETGGFPEHFDKCLLIYDWARPFLNGRAWTRRESSPGSRISAAC
jgi:cytochrome c